jgi:hypothetical protein
MLKSLVKNNQAGAWVSLFLVFTFLMMGCEVPKDQQADCQAQDCAKGNNGWLFSPNPFNTLGESSTSSTVTFNSKLYQARQVYIKSSARARVFALTANGATLKETALDSGENGLNIDPNKNAYMPQLFIFNNKLYIAWCEQTADKGVLHIRVYNGNDNSPSWLNVDGNASGVLFNSADHSMYPFLAENNSKLYMAYQFGSKSRIAVYNGNDSAPSWSQVDAGGLNDSSEDTINGSPKLASVSGKLYVIYTSTYGNCCANVIRSKVYNNNDSSPSWTAIDKGFASGMGNGTFPQLMNYNSKLYSLWNGNQLFVRVYNSATNTWKSLDNGSGGINYSKTDIASSGSFAVVNGTLHIAWTETIPFSPTAAIRVAQYGGNDNVPSWTFIDGNNSKGLLGYTSSSIVGVSLGSISSQLYAFWTENKYPTYALKK